ncbi:isoprenylcysteine carboxylmethyltransferase family protein [Mesorhizobium sp. LHD-90]|uniref:methyltransferase family protein n=1 Tax=Mesorhizobium sp. LHD-90 TaxID=3071414 RepID=UPI0027DF99AE|nr:isoprenylcysteine carboxylmethyltransferase family protein [Mesorhizobium sp. LHD-90]MDQ6436195.1 isoprenylcysteine carboxylmethyltransferase family protein [Mesorhizobium sp. LHD-90]
MSEFHDPKPLTPLQWVAYAVGIPLVMAALVFWPAGTLRWLPGWLFLAVFAVATVAAALVLWRVNPVIFAARSRVQQGTKGWDRVLLSIFFPLFLAILPVASLDAGRFHWMPAPQGAIMLGYVLLIAGIALFCWAQAVNRFFEPGVRIQSERGHRVIDTGPYAFVRHPGYVGAIAMFFGMALALGSLVALLPAAATAALLVLRTAWEDATLREELPGYADFAAKTRYRLLPGVW